MHDVAVTIFIVVSITLAILYKVTPKSKPAKMMDGFVLSYPKGLKIFGICVPLIALTLIGLLVYKSPPITNTKDLHALILLVLSFLLILVYLYLESFIKSVTIGPKGISAISPWTGKRECTWQEIENISYSRNSKYSGEFKIASLNKKPIRITTNLTGIDVFMRTAEEHMPREKYIAAWEKYGKYGRR